MSLNLLTKDSTVIRKEIIHTFYLGSSLFILKFGIFTTGPDLIFTEYKSNHLISAYQGIVPSGANIFRVTRAIYRLRFCSDLFTHIPSLRNLHNDLA